MNSNPLFTILVPSLGRGDDLKNLLWSLSVCGYLSRSDTEVILVIGAQNESDINKAEILAAGYGVQCYYEKRMTKPHCLNTGIKNANGEYIAFTDDDVIITDSRWLDKFFTRFKSNKKIGYVSGNVIAYDLQNEASGLWEKKGGLSKGNKERYWSRDFLRSWKYRITPWPLHKMCAGANCMIPRRVIQEVGPYNILLETPSIPHGSTLDIGYKIAISGYELYYDPSIFVHHKHPRTMDDIKRKLFGYGIGDTAVHMNFFIRFHDLRSLWWAIFGHASYTLFKMAKHLLGRYPLPISFLMNGLRGNIIGVTRFAFEYYWKRGNNRIKESYEEYYAGRRLLSDYVPEPAKK